MLAQGAFAAADLMFDGEALGTPATALRLLSPDPSGEVDLVEQIRSSWNSLLIWLREVETWAWQPGDRLLGGKWQGHGMLMP
jgi:hypothetical protein